MSDLEEKRVHECIDLDTGETVFLLMTDAEFFAYLHRTCGDFRMDDEDIQEG